MVFQDSGPSEDCLFLNVYAPADASSKSGLPVMFWIHGGGNEAGSASEPRHDGDFLPTKGVVLVTINYRLDIFGFLTTTDLAKEAGEAAGNYGLMDMVAALQWVKGNIPEFGGDPGNVTIFGESAGSSAVSTLMAAQPARGLFQKAIGESGGALNVGSFGPEELAEREKQGQLWVESLGTAHWPNYALCRRKRFLPAAAAKGAPRFWVVVDGRLLTEPVADTYAAGKQAHVPLLAGWNRDDVGPPGLHDETVVQWKAQAAKRFGDRAESVSAVYPGENGPASDAVFT
ncbi:MAG: carboxylesterase family protein [Terracidiphilus sp.]